MAKVTGEAMTAGELARARGRLAAARSAALADLVRELGPLGAMRHRRDRAAGQDWAPAARDRHYRRIWDDAAAAVGATSEHLPGGYTVLTRGDRRTVAWYHQVQIGDPVTLRIALDRRLTHRLLGEAGVPVPEHVEVTARALGPAEALLASTAQVVVKPAAGTSGGAGVTCAVDSAADLHRAALHASRLSERLLVEQRVAGAEYRFLFLDGELLDVVRRRPPSVIGDGRSSVLDLIAAENRRRATARGELAARVLDITLDSVLTLDAMGYGLRSVPAQGEIVAVRAAANANGAADNETVDRREVCDELVEQLASATAALGLRLAGLDVITTRLDRPLVTGAGAVIEVNGTPGLHYHYLVADPARATPVAVPLLEALLGRPSDPTPGRAPA